MMNSLQQPLFERIKGHCTAFVPVIRFRQIYYNGCKQTVFNDPKTTNPSIFLLIYLPMFLSFPSFLFSSLLSFLSFLSSSFSLFPLFLSSSHSLNLHKNEMKNDKSSNLKISTVITLDAKPIQLLQRNSKTFFSKC